MNGFDTPAALWLFAAIQILGILSACMARWSEGSEKQAACHRIFYGIMPLMGSASLLSLAFGPGYWLCCSATLACMVLVATCDFRAHRDTVTW